MVTGDMLKCLRARVLKLPPFNPPISFLVGSFLSLCQSGEGSLEPHWKQKLVRSVLIHEKKFPSLQDLLTSGSRSPRFSTQSLPTSSRHHQHNGPRVQKKLMSDADDFVAANRPGGNRAVRNAFIGEHLGPRGLTAGSQPLATGSGGTRCSCLAAASAASLARTTRACWSAVTSAVADASATGRRRWRRSWNPLTQPTVLTADLRPRG